MAKFWTQEGLTFDDVLLVPQYTEIKSRKDVSTSARLTRNIRIGAPIISSNMDTITESKMMIAMSDAGGASLLHRFMSDDRIIEELTLAKEGGAYPRIVSVGVQEDYINLLDKIESIDPELIQAVCIDVAHGACDRMVNAIKWIKINYPKLDVIAGNIATGVQAGILCEAGADALKVGIGNGSMCITRMVAGCGVPLLTSVMDSYEVAKEYGVPIICDGGIRGSSDLVKALAAGASTVITGSMLAGCDETPFEEIVKADGSRWKPYRGMASKDAMLNWRGNSYSNVAAEGESTLIPLKGAAHQIVENLCSGLRSGMTYNDATNIEELTVNAIFVKHTQAGLSENSAHLLTRNKGV
jgi:IMP dehydrogenase